MESSVPSSSSSMAAADKPIMHIDDDQQDVCSICLDSFDSHHNPPTVTICKHEFHLQCILEWSQRSQECPICWQVIVLKDPSSQELLSMVEDERNGRSVLKVHNIYEDPQVDHQVIRTFEAAASSMRYGKRRNRERLSRVGPSQVHSLVPPTTDVPIRREIYTPLEDFHSLGYASSQDTLVSSSSMSTFIDQTSPSAGSSTTTVTPHNRDCTIKSRVLDSQSPNGSPGRPIATDIHAFSESVKSKFSAASARYKESISKSTHSLKEKLLATNSPVKELSRGVQREMSAGIAGVARIFERLDPTLKRNSDGVNSNFFKGKCTQDNVVASPVHGNSAGSVGNDSSNVGTMHL